MSKVRHWKQRWDPNAELVLVKSLVIDGRRARTGEPVSAELRARLGKRLRRWWEAGYVALRGAEGSPAVVQPQEPAPPAGEPQEPAPPAGEPQEPAPPAGEPLDPREALSEGELAELFAVEDPEQED